MNRMLTRGGVEFLAVFLGIGLSFNVEEWREDAQIKNRLKNDYLSIKNDLEKDLPYLIRITEEQSFAKENAQKMIKMLHPDSVFNYDKFMILHNDLEGDNTFFGTQSSYDVSVASGRLTYFGNDQISNEIGKIYSHHYYRIHYNGELLDKVYSRPVSRLVTGPTVSKAQIKKDNIALIKSHNYLAELQLIAEFQGIYISRCEWGIDQIKKVIKMLNKEIS